MNLSMFTLKIMYMTSNLECEKSFGELAPFGAYAVEDELTYSGFGDLFPRIFYDDLAPQVDEASGYSV